MKTGNCIKLILICVAAVILFSANLFAEEFKFDYQRTVDIKKPVMVNLELVKGKVIVNGSEDNQIIINATKVVRASNRDEAEEIGAHIEIKVKQDGDKVVVETNYQDLLNRKPSFWQKILGGGSQVMSEVIYTVSLPFKSGISIKAMDADVELSNIESPVFIEKSTGYTKGEFIFGPVTINQPMGQIDLQWVEGDVEINSQASGISIKQTRGNLKLFTYNGNVNIQTELDSPNEYIVETYTGNINFAVPFTAAGEIHMNTQSGQFSSQIPVEIVAMERNRIIGTFGGGGTRVNINSSSGSVVLAQF